MEIFKMDNTEGYTQERLNELNEQFEAWAQEQNIDLEISDERSNAVDRFHNEVMIYG